VNVISFVTPSIVRLPLTRAVRGFSFSYPPVLR
jgi:hypothetical protein